MSREKFSSNRQIKSVMLDRCNNMLVNLEKENSMNKYLRQSRKQSYDYKVFKKVTDCYMGEEYNQKENSHHSTHICCMKENYNQIFQSKIEMMVIKHVQEYVKKIFEEHKSGIQLFYQSELTAVRMQLEIMKKEYEEMFLTFQDIIKKNIFGTIQQPRKLEKYAKKIELSQCQKNIKSQILQMALRIQIMSKKIQKINQFSFIEAGEKVQPLLLNYDQDRNQIRLQDLKVVVDTFNHNFIQIDAKLKELFSYIT